MSFNPRTPENRALIWRLWKGCNIRSENLNYIHSLADHIYDLQDKYIPITKSTGIPWHILGVIHYRESSLNFSTWLANGDPLFKNGVPAKTVNVPTGLGPAIDFQSAALLSLQGVAIGKVKDFDIVNALIELEAWNGLGYHYHNIPSPYLWSMTDVYTAGKYVKDGVFDQTAVDRQAGCVAILRALKYRHMIDMKEIP